VVKIKSEFLYRVRNEYPAMVAAFVVAAILIILFFLIGIWWIEYQIGLWDLEPAEVEDIRSIFPRFIPVIILCSIFIALQAPRLTLTAFKDNLLVSFHIFETRPKKIYPREIVKIAGINESTAKIYPFKGYMGSHPKLLISKPESLEQNCTHLYIEATTGNFVFKVRNASEVAKRLREIYLEKK
jgi:hypothetical protein